MAADMAKDFGLIDKVIEKRPVEDPAGVGEPPTASLPKPHRSP
jgi:hypothetical protein